MHEMLTPSPSQQKVKGCEALPSAVKENPPEPSCGCCCDCSAIPQVFNID